MNDKRRMVIFWAIVAVIVVATIVIIIALNSNGNKVPENNVANNTVEGPIVNPDAKPDDKPSIGGSDNVETNGGIKTNVSSKIKEDQKYKTYTISGISISYQQGSGTTLTAKVVSSSTEKIAGVDVKFKLYDKTGKYISALSAYIPQIKPGETADIVARSTSDLSNAYSLEIVEDK